MADKKPLKVNIPVSLYEKFRFDCKKCGIKMNSVITMLLTEYYKTGLPEQGMLKPGWKSTK